jgi:hypothetical protein
MAEPSYEELKAKLAQLEKEVEVKKRSGDLIFKVGEKGGVSVYGLGRFPVTLYYEQWNRLLGRRRRHKDVSRREQVKAEAQGIAASRSRRVWDGHGFTRCRPNPLAWGL